MARCGCGSQCTCFVTGEAPIEVTGAGSQANPYVVSLALGVEVEDTDSVDLSLTGTGTEADPYHFEADVRLDPDADQLITVGPNGLFVGCQEVADCIGTHLDPSILYDGTNFRVPPSADAGNGLTIGADGRLYVPGGAVFVVNEGDGVNVTGTGAILDPYVIAADPGCGLRFDPAGVAPDVAVEVASSGVWGTAPLAFPCADTNGSPIYCDAAGELRTVPPQTVVAPAPVAAVDFTPGTVGPGATTTGATTPLLVLNNPSTCREMSVMVQPIATFAARQNQPAPQTFGYVLQRLVSLNGGAFAVDAQRQQVYPDAPPGQELNDEITQGFAPQLVAPGGNITVRVRSNMLGVLGLSTLANSTAGVQMMGWGV